MVNESIVQEIINKPKPLSAEQKAALLSGNKYVRIVAGPGTGKTETLTRRIAYLLLQEKIEPSEIVAFTFTEKAAQSMKTRIYERVAQLKGEEACARLGEMYVGTIHGFCLRVLEDHFGFGDHDVLNENQEMAFILREGWRLGLGGDGRYAEKCRNFIRSVNVVYDELIDRRILGRRRAEFIDQLERYEEMLLANRLLTFGEMIFLAIAKLQSNSVPIEGIRHLIVDEYQDINKAQEALIRLIGQQSSVFIVGDPRQSIYQWRGSDESCFEKFSEIFPACETINITKNRRSVTRVVEVANALAETFDGVRYKDILSHRQEKGGCFIIEAESPTSEAEWVVSQIEGYVNDRYCGYSDIGILLRSVNTSGGAFIDLLKEKYIPYIVGGTAGLFRREEARAVGKLFVWLHEDGFWVENQWNWADRIKGVSLVAGALEDWQNATGRNFKRSDARQLAIWKDKVLKGQFPNLTEVYHELLIILGYLDLDPCDRLQAALMANLGRFNTLLTDYESSIRLGGRKIYWPQAMKGLCWYINTYATGAYEEQPGEDIRGLDAVQIMTIHQAKGLEWPVVFIPCLVNQRFPSSMVGRQQAWFVPRDMFDVERYEGSVNDERKLFYVAITRARDLLCLSRFRRINKSCRESQFISPLKELLVNLSSGRNLPTIQLTLFSEEDEIQSFSAGEIIDFMKCPQFYRFRDLWNYQPGLVAPLGYGRSLHYCLRYASDMIKEGANPEHAIIKAVEERFHLPYAGGTVRETMKNKAKQVLSRFVRNHIEDMGRIDEVEARLEFPVQRATITGRVDVIMRDRAQMEARDYKTSDEVTSPEESAFQVTLYSLGLRNLGKQVTSASVATLEEAKITPVDISEKKILAAKETAECTIEKIKNGDFKPKTGVFCKSCDYSRICRHCGFGHSSI